MSVKELTVEPTGFQLPIITDSSITNPALADVTKTYIVASSAIGLWEGQDGKIAYFDQVWRFLTPSTGYIAYDLSQSGVYVWNGSAWALLAWD